jgi:serine/threonine-protein kinase
VAKEPKQVEVPDVLGSEVNDAVDALEEAGFRVRQREEAVQTPDEDSIVSEQDPPAGQKHDRGSRVTITVGRFEPENLDPDPDATATPTPTP